MANSLYTKPIVLDTFTSEINFFTTFGYYGYKLNYIEWVKPTTAAHTALIKVDTAQPIFNEECVTAKQSIIKYFNGMEVPNIIIAISGIGSGTIEIGLM